MMIVFYFQQKTAYEMRISDGSSDVCSSDLKYRRRGGSWQRNIIQSAHRGDHLRSIQMRGRLVGAERPAHDVDVIFLDNGFVPREFRFAPCTGIAIEKAADHIVGLARTAVPCSKFQAFEAVGHGGPFRMVRSEEHTSELQSLMRISY